MLITALLYNNDRSPPRSDEKIARSTNRHQPRTGPATQIAALWPAGHMRIQPARIRPRGIRRILANVWIWPARSIDERDEPRSMGDGADRRALWRSQCG